MRWTNERKIIMACIGNREAHFLIEARVFKEKRRADEET